jgi:hypothetical protein
MAHIPVNHPARLLYRVLAAIAALYILVFGIVGVVTTWGEPLFGRGDDWVLGLRTNLAFALTSVIFGIIVLVGAVHRTNVGHVMNLTAGVVFLVTGLLMMSLLQTDANFLNFSMSTVIVSLVFGLLFLATGLYDKIGPPENVEERREHHRRSAPQPER